MLLPLFEILKPFCDACKPSYRIVHSEDEPRHSRLVLVVHCREHHHGLRQSLQPSVDGHVPMTILLGVRYEDGRCQGSPPGFPA
jgi:hypothetical protein